MDARRGFFIPFAKCLHELINQWILARMSPVDVQVCPGVTHRCVRVGDMPRAVVTVHAVRHRITEADNAIVIPQVEARNGRSHQR